MSTDNYGPTVFIVTSGEYSDYRIESVWTTREAAEVANRGEYGEVTEWVLNEKTPTPRLYWEAIYNWTTDGEIRVGEKPVESQEVLSGYAEEHTRGWNARGYGPSPEHARKSLADALAKEKAAKAEREARWAASGNTPKKGLAETT